MEAKFKKRLLAYLIDILLLGLIIFIVGLIMPENNNIKALNIELNELNESFLEHEINIGNYINHYAEISYELDKINVIYTIINIIFVILYFVILPYFNNGQTIGKKILKIKIIKSDDKLSMNDLIIRNFIINGLGYMLIGLALIYILPAFSYFVTTLFLGIFEIILILICVVGIIKNKVGLHDKITYTKVIDE